MGMAHREGAYLKCWTFHRGAPVVERRGGCRIPKCGRRFPHWKFPPEKKRSGCYRSSSPCSGDDETRLPAGSVPITGSSWTRSVILVKTLPVQWYWNRRLTNPQQ